MLNLEPGKRISGGFQWSNIVHLIYRFVQIIMACVVIGFYASDLNAARKVHKYADSKWVRPSDLLACARTMQGYWFVLTI